MKKLLTLVLSLMLAVSAAPTAVFAETGAGTATPQPSNEDLGSMSNVGVERITNKKMIFSESFGSLFFYLFFSATIKVTLCILVCRNM